MRRPLAVALAAFALAGCGGSRDGEGDARSTNAGATRLHQAEAAGFSLRLPMGWRAVRGTEALESELEAFGEQNPQVARSLRTVVENDVIDFFAFDPDIEREFATNVNVIRFPVDGTPSFDEWSERVLAETERVPTRAGDVEHAREELPVGEALRIEYENEFRTDAGETTVATLQYVVVDEEQGYVLTFSTLPGQADAYADVFKAAAESFHIVE